MNPYCQYVFEEEVLAYSQKKSKHEQQHGNHHLYELLPCMHRKIIMQKKEEKFYICKKIGCLITKIIIRTGMIMATLRNNNSSAHGNKNDQVKYLTSGKLCHEFSILGPVAQLKKQC